MAKWWEKLPGVGLAEALPGLAGSAKDAIGDVYNDVSGKTQARAATSAAAIQAAQQQKALEEQKRQFDISQANLAPWLQTGQRALGTLEGDLNSGKYNMPDYQANTYDPGAGFSYGQFQFNQNDLQNDPGYQFQLQQGTRALDQGAAARGGALGGNQARALTAYGQGLGAQSYGDAFTRALQGYQTNYGSAFNNYSLNSQNRQNAFNMNEGNRLGAYQQNGANRQQQYGRYSQLAGLGQQTAGQLGQMGANYANQAGSIYGNIGDAQAGGLIGAANSRANGTGNLLNAGLKTLPLLFA